MTRALNWKYAKRTKVNALYTLNLQCTWFMAVFPNQIKFFCEYRDRVFPQPLRYDQLQLPKGLWYRNFLPVDMRDDTYNYRYHLIGVFTRKLMTITYIRTCRGVCMCWYPVFPLSRSTTIHTHPSTYRTLLVAYKQLLVFLSTCLLFLWSHNVLGQWTKRLLVFVVVGSVLDIHILVERIFIRHTTAVMSVQVV
jgi:hypothetical protein